MRVSQNIYEVRDEKGVLKFRICEDLAQRMVRETKGHFRDAKFTSGEQKRIYEFDADFRMGSIERYGYEMAIWKGDKLSLVTPEPTTVVRSASTPRLG